MVGGGEGEGVLLLGSRSSARLPAGEGGRYGGVVEKDGFLLLLFTEVAHGKPRQLVNRL